MLIDVATHGMFTEAMTRDSVVVDLGAHRGGFASAIHDRFGCFVLAVEPAAEQIEYLRRLDWIEVAQTAVGNRDGRVVFWEHPNPQASSIHAVPGQCDLRSVEVDCQCFSTLLKENSIEHVDVLKMDIEGAEIDLFEGMTDQHLQAIPQITVEFHAFNDVISVESVRKVICRLEKLGFRTLYLSGKYENVLFYRPRDLRLGFFSETNAHVFARTRNLYRRARLLFSRLTP